MKHILKKRDVIWGYLSQFLNIASSLLLLPFILRYLNQNEIGIWYVFVAMIGLIQLLEFGLLPTISRFISYIYSGVKEIRYNELPKGKIGPVDEILLNDVVLATKAIYKKISMIAIVFVCFGGLYICTLVDKYHINYVLLCWGLNGFSACVQLYFGYYNSILKGRGDQTKLNIIIVVTKSSFILVSIPLLLSGNGLLSLSIAAIISVVIDRLIIRRITYSKSSRLIKGAKPTKALPQLTKVIWLSAKEMGVVQIANFLSVRAGVFIVSSFAGLAAAASYGLTIQVTMVIVIVSSMFFGLNIPRITSEQALGNYKIVKKTIKKSIFLANVLYLLMAMLLALFGNYFLRFITGNTEILSTTLLVIYLLSALLEMNYSLCTSYLTTKNSVIFLKSLIYSGLAIIMLSFVSVYFLGMGVLGVILSQLIVQSMYNNWKWPLEVYRELKDV